MLRHLYENSAFDVRSVALESGGTRRERQRLEKNAENRIGGIYALYMHFICRLASLWSVVSGRPILTTFDH